LLRPENFCFPFSVEIREGKGRILVATRVIEPLELIMWDEAACLGPRMGGPPVCLNCLKKWNSGSTCERCAWPVCNENCQNGSVHRLECKFLAKSNKKLDLDNPNFACEIFRSITPLRLLLTMKNSPELEERLTYLMDHNVERKKDEELWTLHQNNVNRFIKSCEEHYENWDIDRAVGLLWTNSFACASGGGQALFPSFSFASHSCRPNCAHAVFPNKTLALQAKTRIELGEELTISYISTLQGSLKRRQKLKSKWFFDCNCERCQDPTELGSHVSSILCQDCSDPIATLLSSNVNEPTAEWKCTACKSNVSSEMVSEIENKIATELQEIKNGDINKFEEFLEKSSLKLHPKHYLILMIKRHLVGLYSPKFNELENFQLEKIAKFCEEIISTYEIIDPGFYKEKGTILLALCEAKKHLAKRFYISGQSSEEQFQKNVQECTRIFQESQKCSILRLKKTLFEQSEV